MENATQALLIAFAVLVFVIALTVSFTTLAQAKSTADVVLTYSDREFLQEHVKKPDLHEEEDGGRTVGADTVVATLARCGYENFAVKILNSDGTVFIVKKADDGSQITCDFNYSGEEEHIIDSKIDYMIKNFFDRFGANTSFRESYVEVTLNGETYSGSDGTNLEENVGKKLYIIYRIEEAE